MDDLLIPLEVLHSRVLIVDDEPEIRDEIVQCFSRTGFTRVCAAGSGNEAISRHAQEHADLVITDIRMNNGSGHDLVRSLRANPEDSLPVIFVITAFNDLGQADAYKSQVDAFFSKPFKLDEILAACVHFVGLRRKLAQSCEALRSLKLVDEIGELLAVESIRLHTMRGMLEGPQSNLPESLEILSKLMLVNHHMLQILGWLRLEIEKHEVMELLDLSEVVPNAVTMWMSTLRSEKVKFTSITDGMVLPMVRGSSGLLTHALNMLINDLVVRPPGVAEPAVEVHLGLEDGQVVLVVQVRGATLPRDGRVRKGGACSVMETLIESIIKHHGGRVEFQVNDAEHCAKLRFPAA